MPSRMFSRGRAKVYKRKDAGRRHVKIRGKRYQIWSKKIDQKRTARKGRPRGTQFHAGDYHPRRKGSY